MRRSYRYHFDASLRDIVARHVESLTADIATAVRRNLGQELRAYLSSEGRQPLSVPSTRRRLRSMICIAPKCENRSKGPRFHYLCEAHMTTPQKVYDKWRQDADKKGGVAIEENSRRDKRRGARAPVES